MYLKGIVMEGFKSYGIRTEIMNFDPEFNAITGLNGTGKSNILDAICFVLGITNLSQVRVANLSELIYKNGQAGITRASVTLFFDNRDRDSSPINYEQHDEITITRQIVTAGKNRYMINGSTVTNKTVSDFFNSVHLNVNNPHFLIMQGRITKVLGMKPFEVLQMIEEAAGTRMFENKKISIEKVLEKKVSKIKEIQELLVGEINPKIDQIQAEVNQYKEYQKMDKEIDRHSRILVAYEYIQTEEIKERVETQLKVVADDIAKEIETKEKSETEIKELNEKLSQMELDVGGEELQQAENELKEMEKEVNKSNFHLRGAKEGLESELTEQKNTHATIQADKDQLAKKQQLLNKLLEDMKKLKETEAKEMQVLHIAQKKFQALSCGLIADDTGAATTLETQILTAKTELNNAQLLVERVQMEIESQKEELEMIKPRLKEAYKDIEGDKKKILAKEKSLKQKEEEISKVDYNPTEVEALERKISRMKDELRGLKDGIDSFFLRCPRLNFNYEDPEPNFNRNKVKGLLCTLFKINDKKYARALEAAAGSKLYNVVVDDETISSKLIERGRLTRRTTFAPINKIQGSNIPLQTVKKAQNLVGKENVYPAKSLISFKPELEPVMDWAFGQVLVASTVDVAEKVAYDRDVKKKTITLDGDVFDPSGVISGGAVDNNQPVLMLINEKYERELKCVTKQIEIEESQKLLESKKKYAQQYYNINQEITLSKAEISRMNHRLEVATHSRLEKQIQEKENAILNNEALLKENKNIIKQKEATIKELEKKSANIGNVIKDELKAAELNVRKLTVAFENIAKQIQINEQNINEIQCEMDEIEKMVTANQAHIDESEINCIKYREDIEKFKSMSLKSNELLNELKRKYKLQKEALAKKNKEINQMSNQKDKLTKVIDTCKMELVKHSNSQKNLEEDLARINETMDKLREKHSFIYTDRKFFGEPGSPYDFTQQSFEKTKDDLRRLKVLKQQYDRKYGGKSINDVSSNEPAQFNFVVGQKDTIDYDQGEINAILHKLDEKKVNIVKEAWTRVNKDFNSILSSVLPGSHAELKAVEGKHFMQGLQVKVGFGGVWKESLDELSGGQRSLVALSLILAMLLFKPAPLYILDEVDAALDPSHTQNIGQMLKSHFKQSQFIVVSLKDGMFTNANVIFRTALVEGMSTVRRTTNND